MYCKKSFTWTPVLAGKGELCYNINMKKRVFLSLFCLMLLILPLVNVLGEEEPENLTDRCTLTSSLEKNYWFARITDDDTESKQNFGKNGYVQAAWDESVPVSYLYVEWMTLPESFTVLRYDGEGNLLSEEEGECMLINQIFYAGEGVQAIRLKGSNLEISTLCVYGGDALPYNYHDWEELTGKLDYMIIAMHPDDDTLFMGGIAPTLSDKGLRGTIVYLGTRVRQRCNEALNGAWKMGVRIMPVLAGFPDIPPDYYDKFESTFKEGDVTKYLVRLFRQYQPEVVFTHDVNGEYGHWQHKRCSAATQKAVEKVGDASYDPTSAEQYGAWTVKKLYLHLYEENPIHISMTEPLETYGGRTAFSMAAEAFQEHVSQLHTRHSCTNEGIYSLENFGLYYTAVGLDVQKDDFMENIDPITLSNYVAPTPTPEPTIEPTPEPTPEPTDTPAPTDAPTPTEAPQVEIAAETAEATAEAPVQADSSENGLGLVLLILAVLLAVLLLAVAVLAIKRRK